jgi:hypothetical protein
VSSNWIQLVVACPSILITDTVTKEVATANLCCTHVQNYKSVIPVVVVEHGVAAALGSRDWTGENRKRIRDELLEGIPPIDILQHVNNLDPGGYPEANQYGVLDTQGRAATYLGIEIKEDWPGSAGGVSGKEGTVAYAVVGNFLACENVLSQIEASILENEGDVPQRLMAAVEKARQMGGDGRCSCPAENPDRCSCPPTGFSMSSLGGYMIVARPGDVDGTCYPSKGCANGQYFLDLTISDASPLDPAVRLREQFDEWRGQLRGRPDAVQSTALPVPEVLSWQGEPNGLIHISLRDWEKNEVDQTVQLDIRHGPGSDQVTEIGEISELGTGRFSVELTAGTEEGIDLFQVLVNDGIQTVQLTPSPSVRVAAELEQFTLNFAQFGNGMGFTSDTVLTNPSETETTTGRLSFYDDGGIPLNVGIAETESDNSPSEEVSSVDFSIPPLGSLTISTDGQGELAVGSAILHSSSLLGGVIRFNVPGIGIAGVGVSSPVARCMIPARRDIGGISTGVAIQNTEVSPVRIRLSLLDAQGITVPDGTAVIEDFPALGHLARYVDQLFPEADTKDFRGAIVLESEGGEIAAMAVEMGHEPGQFTTLPVTPLK